MSERMKKLNNENNIIEKRLKSEKWIKYINDLKTGVYKRDNLSDESKYKISKSMKEYYNQNKDKDSNLINRLDKWNEMLKNKKGVNLEEEHKKNITKGQKEHYNTIYDNFYSELKNGKLIQMSRVKVIAQCDINNKLINLYPSISLVTRKFDITKKKLSRVLKKEDMYNGYKWKYYVVTENTDKELKELAIKLTTENPT